jgi:Kef-type K+ transport system membrane component KefB
VNELSSLGLILFMALLTGRVARAVRLPEVTGYILAGVALSPSALGWISNANLQTLHVMSQVALGMILFSIGSALDLTHFRGMGRSIVLLSTIEAALTGTIVTAVMLALGLDWRVALLLGCIAMSTAPAATMMVVREQNASGPLTDAIVSVVAVNKVVVLVAFSLVAAAVTMGQGFSGSHELHSIVGESAYWLIWELFGSAALGYLVGVLLAAWGSTLTEHGEAQILLAGSVLFCIGVSLALHLSPLISSMAVGVTVVNLSGTSQRMAAALSRFDPPIYAMFFVIAGAGIHLDRLTSLGAAGLLFIAARALGKVAGFRIGCKRLGFSPQVGNLLGVSMLSLADLAVGLTIEVARRFPEIQESVAAIVLGAVAFYETLGPIGTRAALLRSRESSSESKLRESAAEHAGNLDDAATFFPKSPADEAGT